MALDFTRARRESLFPLFALDELEDVSVEGLDGYMVATGGYMMPGLIDRKDLMGQGSG